MLQEELINPNQSGFRPSDSCVYQLIVITHEILEAFDYTPSLDVMSVFLDISKAFDIKYGMKECFISSSLWVSQVNFIISLKNTYPTDSKGYY